MVKPTIAELEALMDEPDMETVLNADGSVSVWPSGLIEDIRFLVEHGVHIHAHNTLSASTIRAIAAMVRAVVSPELSPNQREGSQ